MFKQKCMWGNTKQHQQLIGESQSAGCTGSSSDMNTKHSVPSSKPTNITEYPEPRSGEIKTACIALVHITNVNDHRLTKLFQSEKNYH